MGLIVERSAGFYASIVKFSWFFRGVGISDSRSFFFWIWRSARPLET